MTEERACPRCGAVLTGEWVEFPPALKRRYGREGAFYFPPCTPECEKKAEQEEWELGRLEAKVRSLLARSGMPKRLERCTFATFRPSFSEAARRAFGKAKGYLEAWEANREEGRGLYLCGGVGTGKTHLAAALARALVEERRVPTLFVTVPELLDRLRPSEGDPGERGQWASAAMNAEFLVLDDIGAERPSEWVRERLFLLINHRYREQLPTCFTSNAGPKDLAAQLGERISSRVVESCEFVLMDGPDHRVESRRGTVAGEDRNHTLGRQKSSFGGMRG